MMGRAADPPLLYARDCVPSDGQYSSLHGAFQVSVDSIQVRTDCVHDMELKHAQLCRPSDGELSRDDPRRILTLRATTSGDCTGTKASCESHHIPRAEIPKGMLRVLLQMVHCEDTACTAFHVGEDDVRT